MIGSARFTTVSIAIAGALLGGIITAQVARDDQARTDAAARAARNARVQPGEESEAVAYYGRISRLLRFDFQASTLDTLVAYMGYSTIAAGGAPARGLKAADLEKLDSFTLMPRNSGEFAALKQAVSNPDAFDALLDLADFRDEKVLVARFFAPKIAKYYDAADPSRPIKPDTIEAGWRKLVRLTARSKSAARQAGILHMYLLFNVKQKDPDANPFVNESANNQVILVPKDQDAIDSTYFAVYGRGSEGYRNINFLAADFDLPGHVGVAVPGAQDGKYFVPRSCAECHGHSNRDLELKGRPVTAGGQASDDFANDRYPYAKPNYLDTDQWYDWADFDFRGVVVSLHDVLFDGGKDHGSRQYARAFEVFEDLNDDIRDQTFAAEQQPPPAKSFSTLAAEKWLALHEHDIQRVSFSRRSIGAEQWNPASVDEMRLLRLLDNHCFRCHSSVLYNVFDRAAVRERRVLIPVYLQTPVFDPESGNRLPGFFMPQGRVLTDGDREEIRRLVVKLFP